MKTSRLLNSILTLALCAFFQLAKAQSQSVTIIDTIYTPSGFDGGPLEARLWLPQHPNGTGVVLCHWADGDYTDPHLWGDSLALRGYVVLSVDYVDYFDTLPCLYPNPVRDFKTGIEFLRRNAFQFGIYTGRIGAFGASQGAIDLAETIIWDNDDDYFQTDPSVNDHFDAVALNYGQYDYFNYMNSIFNEDSSTALETLLANYFSPDSSLRSTKGNPLANIANITTPVMLLHGDSDEILQVENSIEFYDSLIANGKNAHLIIFPGADHIYDYTNDLSSDWGVDSFTVNGLTAYDSVLNFFQANLHPNENNCPHGKNYWMNHTDAWNSYATPMMLGTSHTYSQSDLLNILNSAQGNDASLKLAVPLIAAKLNAANGVDVSSVRSTILRADKLIGDRTIPIVPKIKPNSAEGHLMILLASVLNSFNAGVLTPYCNGERNSGDDDKDDLAVDAVSVSPNPFRTFTSISFSIPQEQTITLKIFDLEGRLIRTLVNESMNAGEHSLTWNACDENGNTVSDGIYLMKLQTADESETIRLNVVK